MIMLLVHFFVIGLQMQDISCSYHNFVAHPLFNLILLDPLFLHQL